MTQSVGRFKIGLTLGIFHCFGKPGVYPEDQTKENWPSL